MPASTYVGFCAMIVHRPASTARNTSHVEAFIHKMIYNIGIVKFAFVHTVIRLNSKEPEQPMPSLQQQLHECARMECDA